VFIHESDANFSISTPYISSRILLASCALPPDPPLRCAPLGTTRTRRVQEHHDHATSHQSTATGSRQSRQANRKASLLSMSILDSRSCVSLFLTQYLRSLFIQSKFWKLPILRTLKDNYAASFSAAVAREFAAKPQINLASAAGLKWLRFKLCSLMKGPRDPLCHGHHFFVALSRGPRLLPLGLKFAGWRGLVILSLHQIF
jgi:hypothetical protein